MSAWWETVPSQNPVEEGTNSEAGWRRYQPASRSFLFNFKKSNQVKKKISFYGIYFLLGLLDYTFYTLFSYHYFKVRFKTRKVDEKNSIRELVPSPTGFRIVPSPTGF